MNGNIPENRIISTEYIVMNGCPLTYFAYIFLPVIHQVYFLAFSGSGNHEGKDFHSIPNKNRSHPCDKVTNAQQKNFKNTVGTGVIIQLYII